MKTFFILLLSLFQTISFNVTKWTHPKTEVLDVNQYNRSQVFEGFGTSACWWAQTIDDEAMAERIASLLYSESEGLGLQIFRYNIGGGSAEDPTERIGDPSRRTQSFYVFNEETGDWEFDFTRDANARRVMDKAVEQGAKEIILFCNSPHWSMTASGHASGGLTPAFSNLPPENYDKFVDYVLTIADHFVAEGYPIAAVSPINEPQWNWGGDWVGQEGCHYTPAETVAVLEKFAVAMQARGASYALRGPEAGSFAADQNEYLDLLFASPVLNACMDTFSGHSYWMDDKLWQRYEFNDYFTAHYPDKKLEMSEWCELPLTIDSTTIDSGLHMAKIIAWDLKFLNAVSWQSWTAVNGDGLMELKNGELVIYNRYWAYKQFSAFIKPGMTQVKVLDSNEESDLITVAFADRGRTVLVVVNENDSERPVYLNHGRSDVQVWRTDEAHNCEQVSYETEKGVTTLPAKSITTFVIDQATLS